MAIRVDCRLIFNYFAITFLSWHRKLLIPVVAQADYQVRSLA
jgi:hypothetical protein